MDANKAPGAKTNVKRQRKFSARLILGIATLSLVGIVAIFVIVNTIVREIIYENLINVVHRETVIHANEIDSWFQQHGNFLEFLADTWTMFDPFSGEDGFGPDPLAAHFLYADDSLANVYVGFADGSLINAHGKFLGDGFYASAQMWYVQAQSLAGSVTTTLPHIRDVDGSGVVTMALWRPDIMGLEAVVAVDIYMSYLVDIVDMFEVPGYSGFHMLIGPGGEVIVHADLCCMISLHQELQVLHDLPAGDIISQAILDGTGFAEFYHPDLGQVYLFSTSLTSVDWTLVAIVSTTATEQQIFRHLATIFISFAIFVLAIFTIPASFVTRAVRKSRELESRLAKQVIDNRTQMMFDAAPLVIEYWDKDHNILDCNLNALKFYGFSSKSDYTKETTDTMPDLQPDGTNSMDIRTAALDYVFEHGFGRFDFTEHKLSGKAVHLEVEGIRLSTADGDVVVTYSKDVTELKESEKSKNEALEALTRRDSLLQAVNQMALLLINADVDSFEQTLIESMFYIARAIDVHCVYLWENKTIDGKVYGQQLFEWSTESAEFINCDPVLYDDVVPGWYETLSQGKTINNLVRNLSETEQKHLLSFDFEIKSILVIPIFMKGNFWGFVGFDDFCKERLFASEEVAILNSASLLIARSYVYNDAMRNLHDTSVQLETALARATAASKAKGDFLSNMSHEMRTPMNVIIGMTAIGLKSDDLNEKNRTLSRINDAASHLLGVISDILDMAKIEADKMELATANFRFADVICRVEGLARFHIDEKEQTLDVFVDSNIPEFVTGDSQRMAQAITNLLSNAIKFTHRGGKIGLAVTILEQSNDDFTLQIQVRDNGIGIAREQMDNLFEAFEQADSSLRNAKGGTGLGLSITKHIAEMMGGKAWAESKLGVGSIFTFTVQLSRGVEPADADDEANRRPQHATANELKGKHLLIAEDMEVNREVLELLLEDTGLKIDFAVNGKQAVEMVAADLDKYDIVLMDVQMPEMDGLEATRRIRALDGTQHLRIIALTANVFKDDIESCLAAGMNDHLGKPFDPDKLMEKLGYYINNQ